MKEKIKKVDIDKIIEQFPVGAIIEDYNETTPDMGNLLGDGNVQIVAVSMTIRGKNAQMSVQFKHPNFLEDEDEEDEDNEEVN